MMEDLFDEGKIIRIEAIYGDTVERYMRFLKVKELPEFFRIDGIEDEVERTASLITMIKEKVVGEIDSLPADDVRDAFMDMNFGKAEPGEKKTSGEINIFNNLVSAFDFLISQGHSFSAIREYPLARFRHLLKAANDRVFGKGRTPPGGATKMDPLDAFRKLGFRIRRAGANSE